MTEANKFKVLLKDHFDRPVLIEISISNDGIKHLIKQGRISAEGDEVC